MYPEKITFKIEENPRQDVFFSQTFLANLFLMAALIVPFIINIFNIGFTGEPILYFALGIFTVQILISKLLKFNSRKIEFIEFEDGFITLNYKQRNQIKSSTLNINSTQIQLIELKDHRSFFKGLKINLTNENEKYKLSDSEWNYVPMEKIYLEFKSRKNEKIPKNESRAFEQLQIMNGTNKKVS